MKQIAYSLLLICCFFSCKTSYPEHLATKQKYDNSFLKDVQISIHRGGGIEENWPENSLESFVHYHEVLPKAMIECDVRMTKDSVLVLMHDETLNRTSNGSGLLADKTYQELSELRLKDNNGQLTTHKVPTLKQVLIWADQEIPLTIDIKRNIPHKLIIEEIRANNSFGNCLLTTYSTKEVQLIDSLSKNALISVSIRSFEEYLEFEKLRINHERIAAFCGTQVPMPELLSFLNKKEIPVILGVIGELDALAKEKNNLLYLQWFKTGVQIFATDRPFEVNAALF